MLTFLLLLKVFHITSRSCQKSDSPTSYNSGLIAGPENSKKILSKEVIIQEKDVIPGIKSLQTY